MSTAPEDNPRPRTWTRPPLIASSKKRWTLYAGIVVYLVWAMYSIDLDIPRILQGIEEGRRFFSAALTPDFVTRSTEIWQGFIESLTMTVAATAIGIVLSIPIGLGAASNLASRPVYLGCRSILAVTRAFHEVILAILFVAMFGFGPFAGVVTLVVATIGFLGKLIAEDIESIDWETVEAIEATGASWMQKVVYGVAPQIMPRFIGLSLYRVDINFRASAIIGLVGAGGIGATLETAFQRQEFSSGSAILLLIIGTVYAFEYISSAIRKRVI